MSDTDILLDVSGLKCPLPVLRARKAMKPLAAGDVLHMTATDPASLQDVPAFCETTGNALLSVETGSNDSYRFRIRKA